MSRTARTLLASFLAAALLGGCSGGGGGKTTPPTSATPTPTPTATPSGSFDQADFTCPTSDSTSSVARGAGAHARGEVTHMAVRSRGQRNAPASTTQLVVTYASSTAQRSSASIAQRETASGAKLVNSLTFSHLGQVMHVLSVPATQLASVEASLKNQPGVLAVQRSAGRRHADAVTTPYWPNDPYFDGFTAAQNASVDPSLGYTDQPSTYEVEPYAESADVPGQWDMHAIGSEYAFGYSQSGNGSGITNANALGSSSVKIAIIDTGEDPTHPELGGGKIAYQKCFISNPNNAQSTSNYETDPDGHGTDVSGIAAADMNNGLGFAGAGGNVSIYAYRVFPTPDDACENDPSEAENDPQCGSSTTDIASAINDAVAQHVNVISMSLGGDECGDSGDAPNGDDDPTEGAAVANAIAANIVVVAAAGNSSGPPVEAPGCDSGVIAVGATSLDDGQANGSGHSGGTSTSPVEYVASYTDYGTGDTYQSPSSWGIVAPGGDPSSDLDNDDLHWIENIWTSTPFMSSSSDTTYEGACTNDYPNEASATNPDCRTEIAGTSMATPHVAGAAALILSATGGLSSPYQSPAAMRQLLCQTADNIGDPNQGCGRLNVYRAMAIAVGDPSPPAASAKVRI